MDYSEETYKKERHQYSKTIIINLSVPALKEQAYATGKFSKNTLLEK